MGFSQRLFGGIAGLAGIILVGLSGPTFAQLIVPYDSPLHIPDDDRAWASRLKPFIGIEGGLGGSKTNFDVMPPFSVNGTGGVIGINGGLRVPISGTPDAVGVQVGWLGISSGGSIANPVASPNFRYSINFSNAWDVSAFYEHAWNPAWRTQLFGRSTSLLAGLNSGVSVGVIAVSTSVQATSGDLFFKDDFTRTGLVASVWIGTRISRDFGLKGQFRYIYIPAQTINIPGAVNVDGSRFIGTVGVTWYPEKEIM